MKPKSEKVKEQTSESEKRRKARERLKALGLNAIIGDIVSPIDVKWKAMED